MLTWGREPQGGRTPLWVAAQQGEEAATQVLLLAGANKEAKDEVRAKRGGD